MDGGHLEDLPRVIVKNKLEYILLKLVQIIIQAQLGCGTKPLSMEHEIKIQLANNGQWISFTDN